jgi:cysteine desulfurase
MPTTPIYLDAHATTPCDPRVVEAMVPCFTRTFGNASSTSHAFGWEAEALVDQARERVAGLVEAEPGDLVFTSGATESNNLALRGVALAYARKGKHIVTTTIEHQAVLEPLRQLENEGWSVTRVGVGASGVVDPAALEGALTDQTVLISVMAANNEIGTRQPLGAIGALAHARGILFHCDAAQPLAWEALDANALQIDLLSLSAHKLHGPKGVGALWLRRRDPRVRIEPLLRGGGQERALRPGTLNVPGIVGFGRAAELAREERAADSTRIRALRDRLWQALQIGAAGVHLNGSLEQRLPNNLSVAFEGVEGEALIAAMRDVAISSGSACTSGLTGPSYVLKAIGLPDALALGTLRYGLHRFTTQEDVDYAASETLRALAELRG